MLRDISYFSSSTQFAVLAALVFAPRKQRRADGAFADFAAVIITAAVFESLLFSFSVSGLNSEIIMRLYTPLETGLLAYMLLEWDKKVSKIIPSSFLAVALALGAAVIDYGAAGYGVRSFLLECCFAIVLSFRGMYIIMKEGNYREDYRFYIVLALWVYFGFGGAFYHMNAEPEKTLITHSILNISANALFFVALINYHKEKKCI